MAKKYRVKTLTLTGRGGRIFELNDMVTAKQLDGDVDSHIEDGWIEAAKDEKSEAKSEDPFADGLPKYDDVTKNQIVDKLKSMDGVEFDSKVAKQALYDILSEALDEAE